ncbi:MAG: CRISPR-associated helicase Cas3' [Chlorobiales bacterium]|nr:CRISPR-associated helicase Cas3' [Chlorobiales bacterium]
MCVHKTILAKGKPDYTSLYEHLSHVAIATERIAESLGMDKQVARKGAILHDIGKANPVFQERLKEDYVHTPDEKPYRHEIASLFFLSLFDKGIHPKLIEMIVGHHKSVKHDVRQLGVLDLDERFDDVFQLHIGDWEKWSPDALDILNAFEIQTKPISLSEANDSFLGVLKYCERKELGYSSWKGLLIAGDHFASAMVGDTPDHSKQLFQKPDLGFYDRVNELYPLSETDAKSEKNHTIVTASTGAGKTDFLLRRCKGRVFYVLPFQASINAMFHRLKNELSERNPELDIRLLHASSRLVVKDGRKEEKVLQGHIGSAIKVLTPHQIAAIVFGTRGYESMILDVQGCDVILDEIHTYTNVTRAIVLKIVEVLKSLNCRIHVGTATMPSVLYNQILEIFGNENVYQVRLPDEKVKEFDRHIVHKKGRFDECVSIVRESVEKNQKVLIVCNQVKTAQDRYSQIAERFSGVPLLLIHSRFRRGDRQELEQKLMGKKVGTDGSAIKEFNTGEGACIVVATQVVEVSLDISFDVMITDAAPLDALIQRFGRINRKRTKDTIRKYKDVYVIAPPEKDAKPYELDIVQRSYTALPNDAVLHETDVQKMIDEVFPEIDRVTIEKDAVYKEGRWRIEKLVHYPKSVLLEVLDIDNAICIREQDEAAYENSSYEDRMQLEIPTSFRSVAFLGLRQSEKGNKPFIVPDKAYTKELGLQKEFLKPENYDVSYRMI